MLQMAWDHGYRSDNPVQGIRLKHPPAKPIVVATPGQFQRVYQALPSQCAAATGTAGAWMGGRVFVRWIMADGFTWPRCSASLPAEAGPPAEDGETYEDLRGVAIEGQAEVSDDPELLWRVGVAVWERYHGPYTDDVRSLVEEMLRKRVAVRVRPERIRPGFDRARSARSPVSLPGEGGGEREPPRSVRDESFGPRTDCRSDRAARYWLTVACCATTGTRAPARDERSGPQRRSGRYQNEWADEVGTDAARTTGRRWRPGQR
jgi:hypothetical protein